MKGIPTTIEKKTIEFFPFPFSLACIRIREFYADPNHVQNLSIDESNASCFPDLQEGNFSALRAFSLKVDVKQQLRQTKGRGNKDDAQARVINTACKKKKNYLKRLINPQKKKSNILELQNTPIMQYLTT